MAQLWGAGDGTHTEGLISVFNTIYIILQFTTTLMPFPVAALSKS